MAPGRDPSDEPTAIVRYECGVCWTVYDPALGDPYAQVPSGTPFAALPDHWRCPHCDAPKMRFMAIGE
jgi:rubredoxin